jgi:predicted RNase H-like HicB family nuclease
MTRIGCAKLAWEEVGWDVEVVAFNQCMSTGERYS